MYAVFRRDDSLESSQWTLGYVASFRSISRGTTRDLWTDLAKAPASKLIQGASTLSCIRDRIPKCVSSSCEAMSLSHRALGPYLRLTPTAQHPAADRN